MSFADEIKEYTDEELDLIISDQQHLYSADEMEQLRALQNERNCIKQVEHEKKILSRHCCICGKSLILSRVKLKDDHMMCPSCCKKAGADTDDLGAMCRFTRSEVEKLIITRQENENIIENFQATRTVRNILFDDKTQTFVFFRWNNLGFLAAKDLYNYSDIVDFELIQDNMDVTKGGSLGRAVVGGVLFGGVGAVVGGLTSQKKTKSVCRSMQIEVRLKNTPIRRIYSKIIPEGNAIPINSKEYREYCNAARDSLVALQYAYDMANPKAIIKTANTSDIQTSVSNADEIRKYKQLMDDGIISQSEFEAKKKQLLGL